jgi:hypothetical protein
MAIEDQEKIPAYNISADIKRCIDCGVKLTGIYVSNIYKPGYVKCLWCGLGIQKARMQP